MATLDDILLTDEDMDKLIVGQFKNPYLNMSFNEPIKIKRLRDGAKLPECGSAAAAGYDVFACLDEPEIHILPHETFKVGTGLAMEPPILSWVGVFARSGLATKEGLRPANCVGVIDPDYRGEIIVALHNDSNLTRIVKDGEKIAQLILFPRIAWNIKEVEELTDTNRGAGGFGSTGK